MRTQAQLNAYKITAIKNRKYALNESFFDSWSRDMAYILGFITGDGNVHNSHLSIALQTKDIEILEFIKTCLNYSGPIKYTKRLYTYKNVTKYLTQVKLLITSRKIVDKLAEYGIVPNKTGKEKLPNIPIEFIGDYLRGLLDSDGCVHLDKNNRLRVIFASGCETFLKEIQNIIMVGSIQKPKKGKACYLNIGHYDALKLRNLFYQNKPFALKRKEMKYFSVGNA